MGCKVSSTLDRFENQAIASAGRAYYNRKAPCADGPGETRMLIVRVEYKLTHQLNPQWAALDTKFAELGMIELAKAAGVEDITIITDDGYDGTEMATKENVLSAIEDIAGRCGDDDFLVFYYTGHGAQKTDDSGLEEDGLDECWCLVDEQGNCTEDTWLTDDEFVDALTENLPPTSRLMVLSDSCHSGTMCDFTSQPEKWETQRDCLAACDSQHFHAAAMSGCDDKQVSRGTGQGGVFSNSMLIAIERLARHGTNDYTAATLYNEILKVQKKVFRSPQNINLTFPHGSQAGFMPWPLAPKGDYVAPLSQAAQGKLSYGAPASAISLLSSAESLSNYLYSAPEDDSDSE
eukprot:TRINITY_DN5390_c0_g1_i1.p1 TRINITY_DN5390_c0_g1~~TRINITY_DN5390_c0_g1_i1.p1  ORF type:complete len:348 (-),score=63.29 TRINITY_DN5390_c0_g1_i1:533-1576(-)